MKLSVFEIIFRKSFFACFIMLAGILLVYGSKSKYELKNTWSDPEALYVRPDTNQAGLTLTVHNGTFDIIKRHYRHFPPGSNVGDSIDFTKISYLQITPDGNQQVKQLADESYPSGLISIERDLAGTPHFFWAERRVDPEFEEWTYHGPRIANFATSMRYQSYDNLIESEPSISIYEGEPTRFGRGSFANRSASSSIDNTNTLHTIFLVVKNSSTSTANGRVIPQWSPITTYFNKSENEEWSHAQYLDIGHTPDIAVLPNERIVVAGFGSDPDQTSRNDIFLTYSDDGGETWSEKKLIFLSGADPGVGLRLESSPDGTLHLLLARSKEGTILLPEEMWHLYSADGGESWSDPVKFFEIEATSEFPLHHFSDFDSLVDKFGNLHWTTSTLKRNSSMGISERTLFYSSFNPVRERWEQISVIGDTDFPGGSQLEADNVTDELYLIWNDRLNEDLWKVWKYIKKPIREPDPIPDLPVVAESGPLQMHPNYPNPFNNSTNISFTLLEPGEVELSIYDMSGRRVISQDLGNRSPGRYDHSLQMEGMPSGAYIYNIVVDGTYSQQSQMVLVK